MRLVSQIFLLLFISISASQETDYFFSNCFTSSLDQIYCIDVSTDESCTTLDAVYSINNETYHPPPSDISTIVGVDGKLELFCHESELCTSCWSVDNVQTVGNDMNSCYNLRTNCTVISIGHSLGCGRATNCNFDDSSSCGEGDENENCTPEIDSSTGCFYEESTGVQFCATPEKIDCNEIDIILSSDSRDNSTWRINTFDVLRVYTSRAHEYQLDLECTAFFSLENVSSSMEGFASCVYVQVDCIGESEFQLTCFDIPTTAECVDENSCFYNSNDQPILTEVSAISLEPDETQFFVLRKNIRDPIADISLLVNLQAGAVSILERSGCRPTETVFDASEDFTRLGERNWVVLDDCTDAMLAIMQRDNLFYFAVHCSPESNNNCSLTISTTIHTVQTMELASPIHHPLWARTGNQFFRFFPPRDPVEFQLDITFPSTARVAAAIYLQVDSCASKQNYLMNEMRNSSQVLNSGEYTVTYTLSLDPTAEGVVGAILGITVYTTASCNHQLQCGYWAFDVHYQESETFIPYYSDSMEEYSSSDTGLPYYPESTYEDSSDTGLPYYPESNSGEYSSSDTGLPYYSESNFEDSSDTGLPYYSESNSGDLSDTGLPYYSESNSGDLSDTGLPYYSESNSEDSSDTGLPYYSESNSEDSYDTGLPDSNSNETDQSLSPFPSKNSDVSDSIPLSNTEASESFSPFPSDESFSPFPSDSKFSNPNTVNIESSDILTEQTAETLPSLPVESSEPETTSDGLNVLDWVLIGVGSAVFVAFIIFVVAFLLVFMKLKKRKSKFEIGFDDDGLLLGDSDFEL